MDCGAPEDILVDAKPHVGTDRLRLVLIRFRQMLVKLGVTIRYETRLDGLMVKAGRVTGGMLRGGEELPCNSLVLACGHSARDTYEMLQASGVAMEAKPFAVGVRVEHPARIDQLYPVRSCEPSAFADRRICLDLERSADRAWGLFLLHVSGRRGGCGFFRAGWHGGQWHELPAS